MPDTTPHPPRHVPQVMVSSTFTDLKDHREALIKAISKHDMHPIGMEFSDAKLTGDVVDASLGMVAKSAAYILIIGRKYGQTPECLTRNPEKLSITELEYREAVRLMRPVLLFLMGDKHPRIESEIELEPDKRTKLAAFRELAKKSAPGSAVNRVYGTFESLEQLKEIIGAPLAEMQRHLEPKAPAGPPPSTDAPPSDALPTLPKPPAFYAEPDYIGSHQFVGRQAELDALSDWANGADPTNLLLFEAIGGNGKSMLTWEWTTKHASAVRPDWAGRFWYSFYERGAVMQDFCQRALAYMTGQPLKEFEKRKTAEMKDELISQLHARPWLLILDGLERVLVAYHRIDAAEVPDEEANAPTDKILNRNPCDAIRDEDSDLLRALAACAPSKILASSRLTPRILLNHAGQPIPGAKRITLHGLRPPDAEALMRQCGISGDSTAIQDYLQQNCDNHPLVIGILAGLIVNYLPNRSNFDAWSVDPSGGAALDLGKLDIIQRRNHILHAAIDALPDASRQLLSTLALLSESVNYDTLKAVNPHLPPMPRKVDEPKTPENDPDWEQLSGRGKAKSRKQYEAAFTHWKQYTSILKDWLESPAVLAAEIFLSEAVGDLEQRGLLQYDRQQRRHDLHPVVRGVAAGGMNPKEREHYGSQLIDHFVSQPHKPYREAETLEDLRPALNVVHTLLKLGRLKEAATSFRSILAEPLLFNVEAYAETTSILRSFFTEGWGKIPSILDEKAACSLTAWAATTLDRCGELVAGFEAQNALMKAKIDRKDIVGTVIDLGRMSRNLRLQMKLEQASRIDELAVKMASATRNKNDLFMSALFRFDGLAAVGSWELAENTWLFLDSLGRDFPRSYYRSGDAELYQARFRLWKGSLLELDFELVEELAIAGRNRTAIRILYSLRGSWHLEQHDHTQALASFHEAVRMARERRLVHAESETGLALTKFHLGQLTDDDARSEAERLAGLRQPAHRTLAMLWLALGDTEHAKHHALAAYTWAWADGEPYVHRYELTQTTELLQQMKVPVPVLPPYDPAKDEPFPWEADVRAAIEKLKAEKATKEANKKP
ncbi:MAG: DUF4062 domain-containing protein [Prosthecobacter sp.]|uniref:DUF4062 domain-containing protein n=1 Tax=Prosthecobacter sp. TaxID=1965333 RepID=UPI00390318DD